MRSTTFALVLMGQWLAAEAALACSFLPLEPYEIVADPGDATPPSPPSTREDIGRNPNEDAGCGKVQANSCHGLASLSIAVTASDDTTPADDLGYIVELVDGDVEWVTGSFPEGAVRARDGNLDLHWEDGDGRGKVDFELDVWTVDRAGNMSETATRVRVYLDSGEGCAATSRGAGMPWLLLAAGWLWRRRAQLSS